MVVNRTQVSTKVWLKPEYVSEYLRKLYFVGIKFYFFVCSAVLVGIGLARASEVAETVYI